MTTSRSVKWGATVVETSVCIVLFGVVLSILMPAIGVMRENALSARCQRQLGALGTAMELYSREHEKRENVLPSSELPDGPLWFEKLERFVSGHEEGRSQENFACPRAPRWQRGFGRDTISYGWNEGFLPHKTLRSQVLNANETIVIADSLAGPPSDSVVSADGELRFDPRHLGSGNVLFLSGHVALMTLEEVEAEWPRY